MSYATILAKIKSILEGVTGVGTVHDFERWTKERAEFDTLFKDTDKIKTWTITRKGRGESISAMKDKYLAKHTFHIFGRYSQNDATGSEKAFQLLIEDVMTAFRGNETLDGTAQDSESIDMPTIDRAFFGGYLVHECEMVLICDDPIIV